MNRYCYRIIVSAVPTPEVDRSILFQHVDLNARIVGGTPAAQGSVPYMAALTQGAVVRNLVCGGSVISVRTILTAAHCIVAVFSSGQLSPTLLGTVGTNTFGTGGQSYAFARNVTHVNYISSTIKNDIGVLITSSDIAYSNVVQPVTLAFDFAGGGVLSRAAGWGRIVVSSPNFCYLSPLIFFLIYDWQMIRIDLK